MNSLERKEYGSHLIAKELRHTLDGRFEEQKTLRQGERLVSYTSRGGNFLWCYSQFLLSFAMVRIKMLTQRALNFFVSSVCRHNLVHFY